MNDIVIKGRLTRDVELLTSGSEQKYAKFTVAVNRGFDRDNTDFFDCTAFGKQAEFVSNYFNKGQEILLRGQMQCEKWKDREGNNRYSWGLIVREIEFCGSKGEMQQNIQPAQNEVPVPDFDAPDVDDDLPF